MECPSWLSKDIVSNFKHLAESHQLNEGLTSFFMDEKLKDFWTRAGEHIDKLDYPELAVASFTGAFITPIKMGYAQNNRDDKPSFKAKIRKSQNKAEKLMDRASELAFCLSSLLREVEEITRYHPDETRFLTLVEKMIPKATSHLATYYLEERTYVALEYLGEAFQNYPRGNGLFSSVPEMNSQKSTWRDWLRGVKRNIDDFNDMYSNQTRFKLKEVDWVNITQVLIDENISRESVRDALKSTTKNYN